GRHVPRFARGHPVSKCFLAVNRWRVDPSIMLAASFPGQSSHGRGRGSMPRFVTNRRLAFILALCVSLVCAFASSPSFAGGSDPSGRIIDDPYSPEFPNAVGDPDMPDAGGSGKFAKRVQVERGSMGTGWRSAGDSRFNHSVMVMRLRVVLR